LTLVVGLFLFPIQTRVFPSADFSPLAMAPPLSACHPFLFFFHVPIRWSGYLLFKDSPKSRFFFSRPGLHAFFPFSVKRPFDRAVFASAEFLVLFFRRVLLASRVLPVRPRAVFLFFHNISRPPSLSSNPPPQPFQILQVCLLSKFGIRPQDYPEIYLLIPPHPLWNSLPPSRLIAV